MSTITTPRDNAQPTSRAATLWITQAFSGLFLIVILAVHMIAHHFIVEGGLRDYEQVIAYVSNPFVLVLELAFVVVAITHALLGVRAVLLDTGLSASARKTVDRVLILVGIVTIIYGVWLAFALQRL